MKTSAAAACVLLLLSACGQKGPLTLPDHSAETVTPAAASTQAAGSTAADPDKRGERR